MNSTIPGVRRLSTVAATLVATAGLIGAIAVAPATAAEAAGCKIRAGGPTFSAAQATVSAFRFRACPPDVIVDLPVAITRNGKEVARGEGFVVYHCRGTAVGEFRVGIGQPRSFPCG